MAAKVLMTLVLAVVVARSQAVREVWLDDRTTSHISNPLFPKSIGIGYLLFDTLVSCHIIFPNGQMFELYPRTQALPHPSVLSGVHGSVLGPGCGVFFSNSPASLSGTYEILCMVQHTYTDSSRTLTRQRFHITFIPSELWPRNKQIQEEEVKAIDAQEHNIIY